MNENTESLIAKGLLFKLKPGEKVLLSPTKQVSAEVIEKFRADLDRALSREVKFLIIDSNWKVIIVPEKSEIKVHQPEPELDKDTVALLNKDYDLSGDTDLELARIMERLCSEYQMCRNTISTATLDVWNCIVRVAKEILRREGEDDQTEDRG